MHDLEKGQQHCHNTHMINEDVVRKSFIEQAGWCKTLGSPFTAQLLLGLEQVLDRSSRCGRTVLDWHGEPGATGDAVALRFAGALHGLVRAGRLRDLAMHYPPHPQPTAQNLRKVLAETITHADEEICAWLDFTPQTNEVARATLLFAGMQTIAAETGLPLSIFELGSSAGLNLMMDRFSYRIAGKEFGTRNAGVCLSPQWSGQAPPDTALHIIERKGCDLNPLNVEDPDDRARLLAYIWPDQLGRLERTEAAIEIARKCPPQIDRADAAAWVEGVITPDGSKGITRVLFHSITYQYFPKKAKQRIVAKMTIAGAQATPDTPLAWLAFEQVESLGPTLTLRLWSGKGDDGETRVLARANNAHVHKIEWLG
ncbi:MAG: DUF2332 family protein [Devosiaceae bacterium]|nr:DUF2332 family protein [Devosiaceae bacterium]